MDALTGVAGLRTRLMAACLVVAPLLLIIGDLIHPDTDSEAAEQVRIVRDNLDSWYLAHMLALLGIVLLVPAVFAVYDHLRGRAPALAFWGVVLAVLGLMAVVAVIAVEGLMLWQIAQPAGDAAQMEGLWDRAMDSAVFAVFPLSLAFNVGFLLFGIAYLRTNAAPLWVGAVLVVGTILGAVGRPAGVKPIILLSEVLLFAALAWLAARLLGAGSSSDSRDPVNASA